MISVRQLIRLASIPLATTLFLIAAHSTGGFALRNSVQMQVALR